MFNRPKYAQGDNRLFAFDKELERPNAILAVPKKGRLYEKCSKLLAGAGLQFDRPNRLDVAHCSSLPLTIVFLPAADIATYVGEGNVDIGITGIDVIEESEVANINILMNLDFGNCKLCVQAPVTSGITDPAMLAGKRIVTSYPNIARKFFNQFDKALGVTTSIKYVSGSVEAACALGLADSVVDLVETGTTMKAAGLEIVAEILTTEAVLLASQSSRHKDIVEVIRKRIAGYITAQNHMMISYNVSKDVLKDALQITPGKRAATVSRLEGEEEAYAVSALVLTKQSSSVMDRLETAGATDILLFSINNSRM